MNMKKKSISRKMSTTLKERCNKEVLRRMQNNHLVKKQRQKNEKPDEDMDCQWNMQQVKNFGGTSSDRNFDFIGSRLSRGIFSDVFHGEHEVVKGWAKEGVVFYLLSSPSNAL